MERAKVDRVYGEVLGEIKTFSYGVWVAAI
jgi:hypothetical protein